MMGLLNFTNKNTFDLKKASVAPEKVFKCVLNPNIKVQGLKIMAVLLNKGFYGLTTSKYCSLPVQIVPCTDLSAHEQSQNFSFYFFSFKQIFKFRIR